MGGSNVCFADKKGFLLPAEVHLSRLISFKQPFCREERARGSGHILHITQQVSSTECGTVSLWRIGLMPYTARRERTNTSPLCDYDDVWAFVLKQEIFEPAENFLSIFLLSVID